MKHWRKAVIALLVAPGMAALLLQILPREPGWYSALLLFVPLVLAAVSAACFLIRKKLLNKGE